MISTDAMNATEFAALLEQLRPIPVPALRDDVVPPSLAWELGEARKPEGRMGHPYGCRCGGRPWWLPVAKPGPATTPGPKPGMPRWARRLQGRP
jgi:hypothetical protein